MIRGCIIALIMVFIAPSARADAPTLYESGGVLGAGISLGVKVGAGFGQLSSDFGSTVATEFELGYHLPVLSRRISIVTSVGYAGPTIAGSGDADARLPSGAAMEYEIVQHQLIWTVGLTYRIPTPVPMLRPYLGIAWRGYFMESVITASADGQDFGENTETSNSWGGVVATGGLELHFGVAGAIALELQYGWAAVDSRVLRNTNVGSFNILVAYRYFL
ncbi:MAG: hypothetical protein ACI9OJ_002931 [Myxococcota bacterium]|jgi:hypothetical protein